MSAKERLKARLFVVSLLTIGLFGNFHLLLFEDADAHGGSIRQWSVTWTEEGVIESVDKGSTVTSCPYCGKSRFARKYEVTVADFEITRNYLYDGNTTRYIENKRELPGTRRIKYAYIYADHYSASDNAQCGG